jgi:glycosyltransferase involved in cell wall biosynthesis
MFFNEPEMKKFIYDTYFLPIYKVANSLWLRNQLLKLTNFDYPILNPAVEHEIFYPREKHNDEKSIHIVALGKGGWKNASGIYKAVNIVRSQIKDKKIILHYFGHTPPENIQFDNKETIFHKDLSDEDLARLYSESDIQITFSKAESFPLPPLEAMACGAAVITTPYGTEDYAVDGENCLLVEPDNINMLAEKIKLLILDEELRNKLQKNGIKTSMKFNYKDQVKVLEKHLKLAIDENSKRDYSWKKL